MTHVIPGNAEHVSTIRFGPGAISVAMASSLAIATAPFSPMAAGVHSPSTQARGYSGVPGYGVHRFAGRTGPMQEFYGAVVAVANPSRRSRRLGLGAGVSGQPGLPQSGADATGLAYLGLGQMSQAGMGA